MTTYLRSLILVIPLAATAPLAAQQPPLQLKREVPGVAWAGCPPLEEKQSEVTATQRDEAQRLAEAATQSSLLGDKAAALDLLTRAAALDGTSATIAYHLARTLDEFDRPGEALAAYCRYVTLAPEASDAADVRERIRVLATPEGFAVAAPAVQHFEAGLVHYDAGRLVDAEVAFGQASEAAPEWGAPVYNRGLIRITRGQTDAAAADLRRFLELEPGAPEFNRVLDLLATFRQAPPLYNPGNVLVRGLLVPGLGQFTTGRPGAGILVLGTASGAIALGLLTKRLDVDCLSPPVGGNCPPDQVASTAEKRPYLLPAIAAAAATSLLGAIDAYRGASKRNRQAAVSGRFGQDTRTRGPALALPVINVGLRSAQLELIRIRF